MAHMFHRIFGLVLLACTGCSRSIAGGEADGAKIFAEACATCHGPTGRPPESMVAGLGVRDLTAPEFQIRATPALVEHQIRHGSDNKKMPAFTSDLLSDEQVRAVAAFVIGLGR
jgi:mono/diheme cytochrome c family protein